MMRLAKMVTLSLVLGALLAPAAQAKPGDKPAQKSKGDRPGGPTLPPVVPFSRWPVDKKFIPRGTPHPVVLIKPSHEAAGHFRGYVVDPTAKKVIAHVDMGNRTEADQFANRCLTEVDAPTQSSSSAHINSQAGIGPPPPPGPGGDQRLASNLIAYATAIARAQAQFEKK